MLKRYLMVVGIILVVLVGLGVWLKPPMEQMRDGVETALSEYARVKQRAGETPPAVTQQESKDWIIAVSHSAKVGEHTFFCIGGFKVTFCLTPD